MTEPIELDVNTMPPLDLASTFVTRALTGDSLAFAEIGWDVRRYERPDELVAALLGYITGALRVIAEEVGVNAEHVWRAYSLDWARMEEGR